MDTDRPADRGGARAIKLLIGYDRAVARWVGDRVDIEDFGPSTAIGILDGPELVAGIVYNNYRVPGIEMTIASVHPRWCTRSVLRGLFYYPFRQIGCLRATAITESKNQPARAFLCRLGFHEEGVLRHGFLTGDAVVYGMLARECRWLETGRNVHQISPTPTP